MASSSSPPTSPPPSATFGSFQQTQKAIEAMTNKNKIQVPDIDFTVHAMEDGTQVSTLERVCKGALPHWLWLT
jgi:serine/threonine-protein phosphatase 2B catalytic subunit